VPKNCASRPLKDWAAEVRHWKKMKLMLFTDGSVNTKLKIGYGAYLAFFEGSESQEPLAEKIRVKQFVDTSSSKLELQTLLWALSEVSASEIISYTDSQNLAGLKSRRKKLEENDYYAKNGKRLNNHELFQQFYKATDKLNIKLNQVSGHMPSSRKSQIDKIFSSVDRASRNALRAYSKKYHSQKDDGGK